MIKNALLLLVAYLNNSTTAGLHVHVLYSCTTKCCIQFYNIKGTIKSVFLRIWSQIFQTLHVFVVCTDSSLNKS